MKSDNPKERAIPVSSMTDNSATPIPNAETTTTMPSARNAAFALVWPGCRVPLRRGREIAVQAIDRDHPNRKMLLPLPCIGLSSENQRRELRRGFESGSQQHAG